MEKERKLIYADSLREAEEHVFFVGGRGGKTKALLDSMIDRLIKDAPPVDAVEVVHGRWEDEHGGKYANPRYRCSVCKKRALYKFERDLLDNWKEVQALTPNCPYCMAKLDGGIDNDI